MKQRSPSVWTAALCLLAVAPAHAEDVTHDLLTLPLPSGWTAQRVGAPPKQLLVLRAAVHPGVVVTVSQSFEAGKRSLEDLAKACLISVDRGRKGVRHSPISKETSQGGLKAASMAQVSKDAQGAPRISTITVFQVGQRVQVVWGRFDKVEVFSAASKALSPSLKAARAAKKAAPQRLMSRQSVVLDRVSFPLPTGWQQTRRGDSGKEWVQLQPGGKLTSTVGLQLMGAFDPKGRDAAAWAKELLAKTDRGREVVRSYGVDRSKPGRMVPLVSSTQSSRDPKTKKVRFVAVIVLSIGDRMQALYVIATDHKAFVAVAKQIGVCLSHAQPVRPGVAVASPLREGKPGSSIFKDQGPIGSTSIAVVPKAARLAPVPYEVPWGVSFLDATKFPWATSLSQLSYGSDRWGNVFWIDCDHANSRGLRSIESRVWGFFKRTKLTSWPGSSASKLKPLLTRKLGKGPKWGWEPYYYKQFEADAAGNFYLLAKMYYTDYPVLLQYRHDTKQLEIAVSPGWFGKLIRSLPVASNYAKFWFRPAPQPNALWLFVYDGWTGAPYGGKRPRIRIQYVRRVGAERWTATEVKPRFASAATYGTPNQFSMIYGAPDYHGGWMFYTGRVLWRLYKDGRAWPLAVFKTGSREVTWADPVVLKNGDFWFAVNKKSGGVAYTNYLQETHIFAILGGRSRWIRVRLDGKGGVELGEIDATALKNAVVAKGAKRGGRYLFKTSSMRLDHASGGILCYDYANHSMFVVKPTD